MTERAWQDTIVGDRMRVDQEFASRVENSRFTRQQWGLIMTAVDLELDGEGDDAQLVADTSQLRAIMPELERIQQQMNAASAGTPSSGGGILDSLRSALGFGGPRVDDQAIAEAASLAQEYATALQTHLQDNGRWSRVVERATG